MARGMSQSQSRSSTKSNSQPRRKSEDERRREPGSMGWWASPELLALAEKPGFLPAFQGGQAMRTLYCEESSRYKIDLASPFVKACYLGMYPMVVSTIESRQAPDITGHETDLRIGYLSFTVLGAQRVTATSFPTQHKEVLRHLIKMGCPLESKDIAGYTALHHSVINKPMPELARILLEAGASPNPQNKYGATPLLETMQQNHIGSIEVLMEFGASLELADADGITGSTFYVRTGPQVTSVIEKWIRKRRGEEDTFEDRKVCHLCGKRATSFCSGCRKVHYCSKDCQRTDWRAHKQVCQKVDARTTVTVRPCYEFMKHGGVIFSNSDLARTALYNNDKLVNPGVNSEPVDTTKQKRKTTKMNTIIKIQLPISDANSGPANRGEMLVYNQKKSLTCHIKESWGHKEYQLISKVIRDKGVRAIPGAPGVKAYFHADLIGKDELTIHIGEVLAPQPF